MMHACLIFLSMLPPAGPGQKPPPLSEAQMVRLTELVRETRERARKLKDKLQQRQNELTALYAEFDLDVKKVDEIQKQIHTLQQELLANYHHLQVELRAIVGRKRFFFLQKRLARVLGVGGPKEQTPKNPMR